MIYNFHEYNASVYDCINCASMMVIRDIGTSPAGAIAPLLAREALVSRNKDEHDVEMAEQLQIAVWTQILKKQPYLIQQP